VPGACRYYVRTYVCEVKTDLSWHFGNIHGANIIITSFGNFNRFGGKWANKNISFLLSIHNGLKDQNCKKTRPKMSPKKTDKIIHKHLLYICCNCCKTVLSRGLDSLTKSVIKLPIPKKITNK
jgi:hypothetical protein